MMNAHLADRAWFVGEACALADISLCAIAHVCEAGGFRLRDHSVVCEWLARVTANPGYVPMD